MIEKHHYAQAALAMMREFVPITIDGADANRQRFGT